jgi:hypothetical protein
MRCTCLWRHYAHARAVWCSWCTLEWPGYPYDELVTARAIIGRERIGVASRLLTTKIPSALLVAVVWLQHTRCPRFRRGTFGYGITTSPTREEEYEYGVFMRMHVSMPKVPNCILACQKVTWILIHKSWARSKRNKSRIKESIGSLIGTHFLNEFEIHHRALVLITTSINNAYEEHCWKRCSVQAYIDEGFQNYQTTFGITMQTNCTTRFLVQPTAIVNQTRLLYTRVPYKHYTLTTQNFISHIPTS